MIQMGLDRLKKTPCGFCFVQYTDRSSALSAVANLSGSKLDGRVIRVELDAGFHPGRQYGRGRSGGQVRDDKRATGRRGSANMPGGEQHYGPGAKRERETEGEQQDNSAESMEQQRAKKQRLNDDNDNEKKNW